MKFSINSPRVSWHNARVGKVRGTSALFIAVLMVGILPERTAAQYCPPEGECSNRTIPADPSKAYQQNPHNKLKSVLIYDWAPGHAQGRQALRRSLSRLSQQHGFRVVMADSNQYITDSTLAGHDVVIFSQGASDVLGGMASVSTRAMEKFIYAQGKSLLMVHEAAAFIQCPTVGGSDLANPDCRFLARAAVRQYQQGQSDNTPMRVYVDSVRNGEVPPHASLGAPDNLAPVPQTAQRDHGIRSAETRGIFSGLPRDWGTLGDRWYNYSSSPRVVGAMTRNIASLDSASHVEGGANVLLSLDEMSRNIGTQRMGDHPVSWTRKMGNGLAAVNVMGHSDVYVRVRVGATNDTIRDSIVEKYTWRLLRYLARDFVGCTCAEYAEFNPDATVMRLTDSDPVNPCVTPVLPNPPSSCVTSIRGRRVELKASMFARDGAIRVTLADAGLHRFELHDLRGQSIHSKAVLGGGEVELGVPGPGLYVVRIIGPGGASLTRRVVVD